MLDSNGSFDNPFFLDKKIVKIDCKWNGQEYSKDTFGFTHAEYVCSFILKENPEAEIVLVPIVRKNKKSTVLDMIEGIELLIEEQVDIINMSMGDEYKYHKEIEEVCRAAIEKGILIVAAYSNQKAEATYPASFPFVMGVRCLDMEKPVQVLQYDEKKNDVIFSCGLFFLYHLGIPVLHPGNSLACAVVTGYLSNYEKQYQQAILQFKQHDRTLMVYFIGGEPLMAFNLIKDAVDYTKKKCQETNLICKFSTTINGTLVTDEIIDFFVENTFEVKVSLDGPEYVQNLNRRDYAGNGSFEKIMKNLPLLRKYEQETGNQISVASVVTSNNYQYYAESFQFLLDLGIKKLESGIDYYCSWSDEQIQGLREQIEKVFGLYKAYIQKNQEVIFWNLWEQYLKSFLIPCPFYACKAGLTTCYVTTDGGIYTCAELPEFKIGSVEVGLDVPRIREIIYLEDQEDTMCKECQYIRHCKTRGCQVANYEIHQNVYQPIKVNCEMTKWMYHLIQTNLTEKQLEKLKQEYERRYLRHGK